MINLPPYAQIPVNFLTDPAIKHRKITFPPQAPVNVNFPTPACIKAQSSHLPYPEKAQVTVPSDIPIMHCQVHSSTIPDILGMTSLSTACAFTPQPSASTRHRDALYPRVEKRLARVRCIKLSPAQAKVKKRSYAAMLQSTRNTKFPLMKPLNFFLKEAPVDAKEPRATIVVHANTYYKLPSDFPVISSDLRERLSAAARCNNCTDRHPLHVIPTHSLSILTNAWAHPSSTCFGA